MKRLLATAAALFILTGAASAKSCVDNEPYSEEVERACNHGYDTAVFEVLKCPGMEVSNPKLRAKLDAKYRYNPKMKKFFNEYYALISTQRRMTGTACLTASGDGEWLKWDEEERDRMFAEEKENRERKEAERHERFKKFYGERD